MNILGLISQLIGIKTLRLTKTQEKSIFIGLAFGSSFSLSFFQHSLGLLPSTIGKVE